MNKNDIIKFAGIAKQEITDSELALINRQSLKELEADEVYTFKIAACNNIVDRDDERFTDAALEKLAQLYVGKPIISDHKWSAALQTARIYAGEVEPMPSVVGKQLTLRAYMLKNASTQPTIDAIEGGILREVSVGCRTTKAVCNICGTDKRKQCCPHWPGNEYDGTKCHVDLDEPTDAYEVSFVAVPAQPAAGVTKAYGGEANPTGGKPEDNKKAEIELGIKLRETEIKTLNLETEE